jgi:hypothetical protein
MTNIKISEIEVLFKKIFEEEEGKVSSVETLYEMSDNEEFYKLVISIHGLSMNETLIIHTKFIFKTDLNKKYLTDDSFIYLYDINCVYHKVDFTNTIDLKNKIEGIIESNNFGMDIQILSDFIEAPSMFLNYYMKRAKITDYSIFDVAYDPKFKTVPCNQVTFDFDINVNNNYTINLSIKKIDRKDEEDYDKYKFHFAFLDSHETTETESLKNIHYFIGSSIAKILDEKLK